MKKILIILVFIPFLGFGQYQTTNLDFLFNDSIAVNGSDTLLVDSITGTHNTYYKLIDVDFDIALGYLPINSDASIILHGVDTMPLPCLGGMGLRNYNDADTLFTQKLHKVIDSGNDTLITPTRIKRIAHYSSATSDVNDYFNSIPITAGMLVVPDEYATIAAAVSAGTNNDTIAIKKGVYNETTYIYFDDQNIIAFGDVYATSTNTSFTILSGDVTDVVISGLEVESQATSGFLASGTVNNKRIENCKIKDASTNIALITSIDGNPINISFDECHFEGDNKRVQYNNSAIITESFFKDVKFLTGGDDDYWQLYYNIFNHNKTSFRTIECNNIGNLDVFNNKFYTNLADNVIYMNPSGAYNDTVEVKFNYFDIDSTTNSVISFFSEGANYIEVEDNYCNTSYNTSTQLVYTSAYNKIKFNRNTHINTGTIYTAIFTSSVDVDYLEILNNRIETTYTSSYGIRVGNENIGAGNNRLDTLYIEGNTIRGVRYFTPSEPTTMHGFLIGYQSPTGYCRYNYINGCGLNYVVKGTTTTSLKNFDLYYNISTNGGSYGFYSKGIDSVSFYNSVSYNDLWGFYFSENNGSDGATDCLVENSIIEAASGGYAYRFDLTSSSNFNANHNVVFADNIAYYNNTDYTWSTWQGLGHDANSYNTDPSFQSSTQLWPTSGSDAIGNGTNLGSPYDYGLNTSSSWPDNVVLKQQVGDWDIGAYIINKPTVVTNGLKVISSGKNIIIFNR